jgi:hypothetical protein
VFLSIALPVELLQKSTPGHISVKVLSFKPFGLVGYARCVGFVAMPLVEVYWGILLMPAQMILHPCDIGRQAVISEARFD